MSKILIIRFSALGDVAMTIPVIYSFARQFPDLDITILSRNSFEQLFLEIPDNIYFRGVDLTSYKGIKGLNNLYNELKAEKFDFVADFHDVLRTRFLRWRFRITGAQIGVINKGRKEKKQLTRKRNKIFKQLESGFVRYQKVLNKLGFEFQIDFTTLYNTTKPDISSLSDITGYKKNMKWIGIAPFAKHKGKVYPLELQEKTLAHFAKKKDLKVFIFGGGKEEIFIVDKWTKKYPELISLVGKLNIKEEIEIMSCLDIMLSMDSANMHLASLVGTPVISIWGATHPFAGFMGWNQSTTNLLQFDLDCRPCSVFGQKNCFRNDYACMYSIHPDSVIKRIEQVIR